MKKKEEQPTWTVTTRQKEVTVAGRLEPEKVFVHSLRFEGRKVHSLTGVTGLDALTSIAQDFNATNYRPNISGTRLLHELPASARLKLQSYSPELPLGTGGEA